MTKGERKAASILLRAWLDRMMGVMRALWRLGQLAIARVDACPHCAPYWREVHEIVSAARNEGARASHGMDVQLARIDRRTAGNEGRTFDVSLQKELDLEFVPRPVPTLPKAA